MDEFRAIPMPGAADLPGSSGCRGWSREREAHAVIPRLIHYPVAAAAAALLIAAGLLAVIVMVDLVRDGPGAEIPRAPLALVRSADLLGRQIEDAEGRDAGALVDVLVDAGSGDLCVALVDDRHDVASPAAAEPAQLVRLAWSGLRVPVDRGTAIRASFATAPGAGAPPGRCGVPEPAYGADIAQAPSPAPLVPLSRIADAIVTLSDGGDLGWIESVLIDPAGHRILYVLVDCGYCGGPERSRLALPYRGLIWSARSEGFSTAASAADIADRRALLSAPRWRDRPSAADLAALHRAFAVPLDGP